MQRHTSILGGQWPPLRAQRLQMVRKTQPFTFIFHSPLLYEKRTSRRKSF